MTMTKKVTHPEVFNKLLSEYGKRCAWFKDNEYHFTLSDNVMNDEAGGEMEEIQKMYGEDKVHFWIGYGDDSPNAVSIKDKSLFDDNLVVGYLNSYIGRSCYDE
jgi:hypothetical protein